MNVWRRFGTLHDNLWDEVQREGLKQKKQEEMG
jgi:hypothetical protein